MVNILMEYFHPRSVVDVGCGNAEFLSFFHKKGVIIKGYDGSSHAIEKSLVDPAFIELHDLRDPILFDRKFDLVLCLEVAEHVENKYSKELIGSLARLSDNIVFTAATPGQGGHFHINEQPRGFWVSLWSSNGYKYNGTLTELIKKDFKEKDILCWYSDNLMIFQRDKI